MALPTFSIRAGGGEHLGLDLAAHDPAFRRLPFSLKVLAENVLFHDPAAAKIFRAWLDRDEAGGEVQFRPSRVIMHDTTCVPALVDLATLRDEAARRGFDPRKLNPQIPLDLVVDHSVIVDRFGSADAAAFNLQRDFARNAERYRFFRWAEKSLARFRVVPPGKGIIHQINLENLGTVVRIEERDGRSWLRPETLLGTDSHTPMINALGILGWGVGGAEGVLAVLGEPVAMQLPPVTGTRLSGRLREGVTATDLALTLTELFRREGVVDQFVEFFGPGVTGLSIADRATIANMAPEYGATCSFFPVDSRTLDYLSAVGRSDEHLVLIEAYCRAQGLWHEPSGAAAYSRLLEVDLGLVDTSLAGPCRPHDRVSLGQVAAGYRRAFPPISRGAGEMPRDGAVLIAAITSCTNTSNPALMLGAGLLARRARAAGLRVPWWVKTSLSPGSQSVSAYLQDSGLQSDLDALGFQVTGHGCMTCIGNSGSLDPRIEKLTRGRGLQGVAVLSGNRNFQGRINPDVSAAYLASPALVVAYALAGSILVDLEREPVGHAGNGDPVFLRDLWPGGAEIEELARRSVTPALFRQHARDIFQGPPQWQALQAEASVTYPWDPQSTYLRPQPYFGAGAIPAGPFQRLEGARALLTLGDDVTTDQISPAGEIPLDSLAGKYLREQGVEPADFNQYSTRRGNHEVMRRGLFGGSVYARAGEASRTGVPLLIFAGRNYGAGSSRDWAAKGPALLGVRAVIAESFERIHRANLVAFGVLPLQFEAPARVGELALTGQESFTLDTGGQPFRPRQAIQLSIIHPQGGRSSVQLRLRAETEREAAYLRCGGLFPYVLDQLYRQRA